MPKLYGERDADFDGSVADEAVVNGAYADLEREQAATDAALAEHPDLSERVDVDRIAIRGVRPPLRTGRSAPRTCRRSRGAMTDEGSAGDARGPSRYLLDVVCRARSYPARGRQL